MSDRGPLDASPDPHRETLIRARHYRSASKPETGTPSVPPNPHRETSSETTSPMRPANRPRPPLPNRSDASAAGYGPTVKTDDRIRNGNPAHSELALPATMPPTLRGEIR